MDQVVAFAYWQSQGIASTPDQAIESFRANAVPLTPTGADLTSLLGGMNPYSIMGLDPAAGALEGMLTVLAVGAHTLRVGMPPLYVTPNVCVLALAA